MSVRIGSKHGYSSNSSMPATADNVPMISLTLRELQTHQRTRRARLQRRRSPRFCGIIHDQPLYAVLSAMVAISLVFCFLPIRLLDDDLNMSFLPSRSRLLFVAETGLVSSRRRQQSGGKFRALMLRSTGVSGTPRKSDAQRASADSVATDSVMDAPYFGLGDQIRRLDDLETSAVGASTEGDDTDASQLIDGKTASNDGRVFGRPPLPDSDPIHKKDHDVRLRIRKRTSTSS
jgi:hypothetical protein